MTNTEHDMLVDSTDTWSELKDHYFDNLNTLHDGISNIHDSSIELSRLYREIIKKSKDSSSETVKTFVYSWMKKIDPDNVELMPLLKDEYEKIQSNPTEINFEDLGSKIQQKLHRKSISILDAYDDIMHTFYDTWEANWPRDQ